nr:MAG TPA: tail tape measure protein [Caudoviricetes sp.]
MVDAAGEFRKNGFNDQDAATLARTAAMFQNVSDEAISAGDSASFIISQMIAFGIEAENAQSIIDKVNEVANRFSVSSGDLSKALGIVASTSSAMGNSIDQTLGVVTAITEQTRNASKSARAANTIFSRLAQVVDENSDVGQKLTGIYNSLGIALYDSSGQMRSTYDILADLASQWGSLDKNTQQYIAITSAGTNQLNNFLALMNNFGHATQATATSIDSAGSAMKENEAFQESLEYQTNNLKATFQDFANNVLDKEVITTVIKVGDAFLKLANTDIGQLITKVTLLGGLSWGLTSLVKVSKLIPIITRQFSDFGAVLSLVVEGSGSFRAAIGAAGGAAAVALPILLAISAAIVAIVEAVKIYKETHPDFETAQQDAANLAEEYKNTKDRLDEINAMEWKDRTAAIEKERQELEKLREEQEKELNVAQMREAQAANRELSGRTGTGTATRVHVMSSTKDVDTSTYTSIEAAVKDLAEQEGLAAGTTEELKEQLKELGYAFLTMREETNLTADEVNALDADALKSLGDELRNTDELTANQISRYQELHDKLAPVYQQIISLEEAYLRGDAGARQLTSSEKELKLEYGYVVTAMRKFNSEGQKVVDTVKDLNDAAEDTGETMGKVLTDSLFDVNGNLTETAKTALTTNSALKDLAVAELEAQQQAATANYQNLISQISQIGSQAIISGQTLAQMLAMANIGTGTYQDERDLKRTFAYKFKKSADANPAEYNRWLTNYISQTASSNYERQMAELSKKMGQIQGIGTTTTDTSGGGSSKTKSAAEKAAEEAAAAAKQAWENQKQKELWELEQQEAAIKKQADDAKAEVDDYKNQLTAISKAQKEQTDAIKKELEAQLKVIQAQKDALESQKDALDVRADDLDRLIDYNQEYADKQIENLEAEKDAIQETIDAINEKYDKQIEALETTNKELDKEIEREKLLKALADARAKKTLVFKNGRFTYEQDIEAVSKAQADLDKFDREQQIEKEKDLIEENRKNELQYSKDEQAALDAEIERWKKYKDGWANLVSDYNYQQNALLAAQKYGLNLENQTWTQRLNNVSRFAKDYANIVTEQKQVQSQLTALQEEQARLQEIASARQEEVAARMQEQYDRINALMEQAQTRYNQYQEQLKNIQQNISDTKNQQYTDLPRVMGTDGSGKAPSTAKIGDLIVTGGGIYKITGGYYPEWQSVNVSPGEYFHGDIAKARAWLDAHGITYQYARGTTSAHNGISLVGEQGPELRVTKSGDGILPAAITQNLWSWGKLDPDKVLGGAMHNLGNLVFNNANLSFPNIRSGSDARLFVENLKNLAYQYAFAR